MEQPLVGFAAQFGWTAPGLHEAAWANESGATLQS
jgi:hypothetical protein